MSKSLILSVFSIVLSAQSAVAEQTSPLSGIATPLPCEMHIWPADTTHTTYQGWGHAGKVDGARRGIKGYPDLGADALDTKQQVRLLTSIDWPSISRDPTLKVVVHAAPTGADDDRSRTTRLVADSAPCYRELIITSSIIEAEVFSSRSVRILALRKRFDGANALPVNFSSMAQVAIAASDEDKAASNDSAHRNAAVQAAFIAAVGKFGVMQTFH